MTQNAPLTCCYTRKAGMSGRANIPALRERPDRRCSGTEHPRTLPVENLDIFAAQNHKAGMSEHRTFPVIAVDTLPSRAGVSDLNLLETNIPAPTSAVPWPDPANTTEPNSTMEERFQ